jgi:valyl-tRNA synthetase
MPLSRHYDAKAAEARWQEYWREHSIFRFNPASPAPVFSIDTPPPTVSGSLHVGHVFSYTHTDVIARYRRMRGFNVFYPMGSDDNGLPTERLTERLIGRCGRELPPAEFRQHCAAISRDTEAEYERIWRRMGLSVDWLLRYTTMDAHCRRIAQRSFVALYRAGRIYRKEAPALWCPECCTAIAQAEADEETGTHERCGTPTEVRVTPQWFLRILDMKDELLAAGRQITWHPAHMRKRYEHWIEELHWDWCISRQRVYGVPFPLWHCGTCGEAILASEEQLPVDPSAAQPPSPCLCGSKTVRAETDVMDTWFTSSLTPLINSRWGEKDDMTERLIPMSLRPQAHDIIRTWAFYTLVKSHLHLRRLPWSEVLISGHAIASAGHEAGGKPKWQKISKSKQGGSDLLEIIHRESADAIRYWACCARAGHDMVFRAEDLAIGRRLATKLFNATKFAADRLSDFAPTPCELLPLDRWLLSRLAGTISQATTAFEGYDWVTAKETAERFFWDCLCDNYIEMAKNRLYGCDALPRRSAQLALRTSLDAVLRMFAPIMPFVTEELHQLCFAEREGASSIHTAPWPVPDLDWHDEGAEAAGNLAVAILDVVRRKKTEAGLSSGAPVGLVRIHCQDAPPGMNDLLADIACAARASGVFLDPASGRNWTATACGGAGICVEAPATLA